MCYSLHMVIYDVRMGRRRKTFSLMYARAIPLV